MQQLNWDDLRIFLAVARGGGLLPAARKLGVDHATVSRRLSALEGVLGERLALRTPRGVSLTPAGLAMLDHVEGMEAQAMLGVETLGATSRAAGIVRVATPEAFGNLLVAPAVGALLTRHPGLQVELVPQASVVNLSRREADLAITLARPAQGRLRAQKLADYGLGLFASREHLAQHGPVASLDDLRGRPFVWYVDDLLEVPELRFIDELASRSEIAFRSSSIAAQQAAIASGFGVGVLHVFAARQDDRLVRLLPEAVSITRSYWLVSHADQRDLPRIRVVSEFLTELVRGHRAQLQDAAP